MIQSVIDWLSAQPGLEALTAEHLGCGVGSVGVFCQGQEVRSVTKNILGGQTRRLRLRFILACHAAGGQWPQSFLTLAETALPTAPILGRDQTVTLEKGRLTAAGSSGVQRCEAQLTFEFTVEV